MLELPYRDNQVVPLAAIAAIHYPLPALGFDRYFEHPVEPLAEDLVALRDLIE